MLSIIMFMLSGLFLLYYCILLFLFPLKFCQPFWFCSQINVLVIGWWEWVYGMYSLNKQHLMTRLAKFKLCWNFFLDIKLSLLLYPFFRNPAQAGTCGCVVVLIENWGWEYWKAESSCCLCSFACVLPGSSSFPTTFSLLGNAPKPTYFPLSNNNSVTFLLSYLPSFELLLCTLFSDWCIHWAGESVL